MYKTEREKEKKFSYHNTTNSIHPNATSKIGINFDRFSSYDYNGVWWWCLLDDDDDVNGR
jgi:hypothetical protein